MDKATLRRLTLSHSLFVPTTLEAAIVRLKFVQIDPIRSPARAHDLILRQRVEGYQQGDMEKNYVALGLEEDFLYAHGFMTRDVWQLMHPRAKVKLTKYDRQVLEAIQTAGKVDPKDLVAKFGAKTERNWWGGTSQASRMALERLHHYGLIRIAERQNGKRVYAPFVPPTSALSAEQRLEQLVLTIARVLAPVTYPTLRQALFRMRRLFGHTKPVIDNLVKRGELTLAKVDGLEYLWPSDVPMDQDVPDTVKFLAPFDPVVWDRLKFEHLWGWPYRFEAYVPKAKRVRGYYAMPLLWRDQVTGWANIDKTGKVEVGFVDKRPAEKAFTHELDKETALMHDFIQSKPS